MTIQGKLKKEIRRNKKLLEMYRRVPTGELAATVIEQTIKDAEEALEKNDPNIFLIYQKLREFE